MRTVNMLEAKSSLSRLVEALEQGEEHEIIIARNGRPAAKLVPMRTGAEGAALKRIGVAKGIFQVPENIDSYNDEIASLFLGEHA
jgi:antitoxin (DNA-binding transcriptional repressor) of toxin-antitoxin stability system